jgi:thioredoxin 1
MVKEYSRRIFLGILGAAAAVPIIGCGSGNPTSDAGLDSRVKPWWERDAFRKPDKGIPDTGPEPDSGPKYSIEVSPSAFDQEVLKATMPVVVDFYATWCGGCKKIASYYEQLAKDNPKVKFVKFNVDQKGSDKICTDYGIDYIPNFHFIYEGTDYTAYQFYGADEATLKGNLEAFLNEINGTADAGVPVLDGGSVPLDGGVSPDGNIILPDAESSMKMARGMFSRLPRR